MAGDRSLWVGPYGSDLRARALLQASVDAENVWIVPSALARDQVERALVLRRGVACRLRVWIWDDLWRELQQHRPDAPLRLSDASSRALLTVAIGDARRAGELQSLPPHVIATSGFRRHLRRRLAAWTRAERDPNGAAPPGALDYEWRLFVRYRELLRAMDAEDTDGFAAWASRAFADGRGLDALSFGHVTLLDPTIADRAAWRALTALNERARSMLVTLAWDPACPEAFEPVARERDRLLEWGFRETCCSTDAGRPAGLRAIESALFRDASGPHAINETAGLKVLGAPQGEGVGLVVAREVTRLLECGTAPEEILLLVPAWDEHADVVAEVLRSWGLPIATTAAHTLARAPAVTALRLAASLPAHRWDADRLVRLLRNGQIRPNWLECREPLALTAAAAAVRDARVFRGAAAIRAALQRAAADDAVEGDEDNRRRARRAARARAAAPIVERLLSLYEGVEQPAAWNAQTERLRTIWSALTDSAAASSRDQAAIETLWEALDDLGPVWAGTGRGDRLWTWAEFVRAVDSVARDQAMPVGAPPAAAIRLATVAEAEGAQARHIILLNLAEGTFPAREAIQTAGSADEERLASRAPSAAYAREMRRFLSVLGAAEQTLTLVYPSADEKGQALLTAGFLDDVERLVTASAWTQCRTAIRRLDPVLSADLAGSPREARVRAVARALVGETGADKELKRLASSIVHWQALRGTAAALHVAAHRTSRREIFGPYEGRLTDPLAIRRVAESFGTGRAALSASQLESFALCPFQFFLRYVLHIEGPEERAELEEDRTFRGSRIHQALEQLHTLLRDTEAAGSGAVAARVALAIADVIETVHGQAPELGSDIEAGLHEVERLILHRFGQRYSRQFASYSGRKGPAPECHRFEVEFGKSGAEHPSLVIGEAADAIQIQGKIDRIDLVREAGVTRFRVIDYKSGASPPTGELRDGLALQLPLYAYAVERLELAGEPADLGELGYWLLRTDGYKPVQLARLCDAAGDDPWPVYREKLESFLLGLARELRRAAFPVAPRVPECTKRCDYGSVCRILQVRPLRTPRAEAPRLLERAR